jgi:hypothetical protein
MISEKIFVKRERRVKTDNETFRLAKACRWSAGLLRHAAESYDQRSQHKFPLINRRCFLVSRFRFHRRGAENQNANETKKVQGQF